MSIVMYGSPERISMSKQPDWEGMIRAACHDWPKSLYSLAKESGVDEGQLRRFIAGRQSVGIATAEKIGRVLGFELTAPKRRLKK